MATEILAIDITEDESGDVVVGAGDELTVALKGEEDPLPRNAVVKVQLKDDDGNYWTVDSLKTAKPALVIRAGTWRFARVASVRAPVGVFSA